MGNPPAPGSSPSSLHSDSQKVALPGAGAAEAAGAAAGAAAAQLASGAGQLAQQHGQQQQRQQQRRLLSSHAAAAAVPGAAELTWPQAVVRVSFFLWASLLNLVAVSSLWARSADVFSPEAAGRLFGLLGAGATLGQLLGSLAAGPLARAALLGGGGGSGAPSLLPLLASAIMLELAGQAVGRYRLGPKPGSTNGSSGGSMGISPGSPKRREGAVGAASSLSDDVEARSGGQPGASLAKQHSSRAGGPAGSMRSKAGGAGLGQRQSGGSLLDQLMGRTLEGYRLIRCACLIMNDEEFLMHPGTLAIPPTPPTCTALPRSALRCIALPCAALRRHTPPPRPSALQLLVLPVVCHMRARWLAGDRTLARLHALGLPCPFLPSVCPILLSVCPYIAAPLVPPERDPRLPRQGPGIVLCHPAPWPARSATLQCLTHPCCLPCSARPFPSPCSASPYLLHLCAYLALNYITSSFFYFEKTLVVAQGEHSSFQVGGGIHWWWREASMLHSRWGIHWWWHELSKVMGCAMRVAAASGRPVWRLLGTDV